MAIRAFCCISTGEYRFPAQEATGIAVRTVLSYLQGGTALTRVVFNVFKDSDMEIYRRALAVAR